MTYIPAKINDFNTNAASATRVAQMTTLFDGRISGAEDTELWEVIGTGGTITGANFIQLTAGVGTYRIRQSIRSNQYFAGKTQLVEMTFDGFVTPAGLQKRVGYFSSSTTAPYTANLDGFFLESNSGVISLQVWNNGTQKLNVPLSSMDNGIALTSYNWANFTVIAFDFLWLGGAVLRLFVKTNNGFELIHTYNYAGTSTDTFIENPNQPVRYEIRSTTAAGNIKTICSQVSTEGSIEESGKVRSYFNDLAINANTVYNNYALIGVSLRQGFEKSIHEIAEIGVIGTGTTDTGILYVVKNPTYSAGTLTYANVDKMRIAFGNGTQLLVSNTGTVIAAIPTASGTFPSVSDLMKRNILGRMSSKLANPTTPDEFVLAYRVLTANQAVAGLISIKSY